ncbi:hypothetical protein D3C72_1089900 [compost metagenome]
MDLTPGFRHAGIPGNDFDPALHRFFQHRHQRIGIVGGDGDRIYALGDQTVQHFDLRFGGGGGRAGINDFHITQFFGGLLRAHVRCLEESISERFRHQGDFHFCKCGTGQRQSGNGED